METNSSSFLHNCIPLSNSFLLFTCVDIWEYVHYFKPEGYLLNTKCRWGACWLSTVKSRSGWEDGFFVLRKLQNCGCDLDFLLQKVTGFKGLSYCRGRNSCLRWKVIGHMHFVYSPGCHFFTLLNGLKSHFLPVAEILGTILLLEVLCCCVHGYLLCRTDRTVH